jgi:lipid-A-disaccharide synthase
MARPEAPMKLCVVAGEASGDLHATEVIRELRKIDPALSLFGIGGGRLAGEGMRLVRDARDLAIVGLFNVLRHLPMYLRAFSALIGEIERERPDAVLLVDYPDFNLRVARECRRRGIPVVYYISPQVWAWRAKRVHQIAARVDRMLVIFPFEKDFYDRHGVPVTYVGHPLVEQLAGIAPRSTTPPVPPWRIALLPGSRRMEVGTLLGPMLDAVERLGSGVRASVIVAPSVDADAVARAARERGIEVDIVTERRLETLAACDLALCSSGTATLEAAILGVPSVVVYKLPRLTYALGRRLVRLPHFSLVNIVAGREVVPELIQDEVEGERIATEAKRLLEPANWAEAWSGLDEVRRKLGGPGASRRAAEKIATLVDSGEGRIRR